MNRTMHKLVKYSSTSFEKLFNSLIREKLVIISPQILIVFASCEKLLIYADSSAS